MTAHKEFADDLALYALGALEPAERSVLEKHLNECSDCLRELEQLRGDSALLAMSLAAETPPARTRGHLMAAIAAESRTRRAPQATGWAVWIPSLAAVALLLIAIVLWRSDTSLRLQIARLQENYSQQQEELRRANAVLATLSDPSATRFTLSADHAPPRPQGKAIYVRNRRTLIFLASNMPALPSRKTYELWLIPTSGAPIPAGVFKPDVNGSATLINPPLPGNAEAKAFAVTVEPEGGSSAPSTQPIMVGTGG